MNDSQLKNEKAQPIYSFVIRGMGTVLYTVSALVVGIMMLITFIDVAGRYLFNRPVVGTYEITEILMGLMIFGALPLVTYEKGHISVDFITNILPKKIKYVRTIIFNLIGSILCGILAWQAWLRANHLVMVGEKTMELDISWGVIAYGVSFLLGCTSLVFIFNMCEERIS